MLWLGMTNAGPGSCFRRDLGESPSLDSSPVIGIVSTLYLLRVYPYAGIINKR